MKLRILQVASGLRSLAGTEKHVLDISASLARRGHAVTLACRHDCPLEERAIELGLQQVNLEMHSVHDWRQLPRFLRVLAGNYDIIHIHSPLDYIVPAFTGRLARIPMVVMTRHLPHPFASRRNGYLCASVLYDRIIAVSNYIRGILIGSGARPDRVDVVPNGIDPIESNPLGACRLRKRMGIPQDAILIGAAGRLSIEKGFDVLLNAVHRLKASGTPVYCLIFGEGSMLEPLRNLAAELQLESIVQLPGFRGDVHDLWRAADIAVIPSMGPESFGYTALEALSAGCVVVASSVGALPEVTSDASAILTTPGDVTGLTAAIGTLVRAPELRKKMQLAARKRANIFTLDANIEGIERVYMRSLGTAAVKSRRNPYDDVL